MLRQMKESKNGYGMYLMLLGKRRKRELITFVK